jgi:hypothetical protein
MRASVARRTPRGRRLALGAAKARALDRLQRTAPQGFLTLGPTDQRVQDKLQMLRLAQKGKARG